MKDEDGGCSAPVNKKENHGAEQSPSSSFILHPSSFILVLGLGISGRSASRLLLQKGARVVAVDAKWDQMQNDPDIQSLQSLGLVGGNDADLKNVTCLILSPGIPDNHPLCLKAKNLGIEIIGEIELACRFLKHRMIGITGSNGKTTVTLMIAHLLNHCGIPARAFGNVGIPLTSLALEEPRNEVIVLELSSYQLETLCERVLDAAVILNITPNHLDRYPGMKEYAEAKLNITHCLKKSAPLYLLKSDHIKYKNYLNSIHVKTFGGEGDTIFSDGEYIICDENVDHILPLGYRGRITHDITNYLAAYALCREMGARSQDLNKGIESFKKPPHRIEFVTKKGGVSYYDDSKGTSIDAVVQAVGSLKGSVVLIAGGLHKGYPYTSWLEPFKGRVKGIFAIGQAGSRICEDLSAAFPVTLCETLEEAVRAAAGSANEGDNVLLSPGCASFDMFKDYAHRGDEFQRLVHQL